MARPDAGIARAVLANGLTVLVAEMPGSPVVSIALSLEAGSRYDDEKTAGVACLAANAVLEGPRGNAGPSFARLVEAAGTSFDAFTGYETAVFVATALPGRVVEVLGHLFAMIADPALDERTVARARRAQASEIASDARDAYQTARREFFDLAYGPHPRRRPVVGYAPTVAGLTAADTVDFCARRYRPGGAVLAIAGGVRAGGVLAAADRASRAWRGDAPLLPDHGDPPGPGSRRTRFVPMRREQVHLCLGHVAIRRSDPRYHALEILDAILGDCAGFGSRLAKRLREREGLAYVVESDTVGSAGIDPGVFWAYTATSPANAAAAVGGIREEIRRVVAEPPSDEEVAAAVSYLRGRRIIASDRSDSRALGLVRIERRGLGLDFESRYPGILSSIGPADVLRAARDVIRPDDCCLVAVGPSCDLALD